MTAPARTFALVVGIERYEAGDRWNLDGPVRSAMRIVKWLRDRVVPARNITVLLSPLDTNRPAAEADLATLGFPVPPPPATVDVIRRVVSEDLPTRHGDLLVVFWAGHGVLDGAKQRRLFCANAAVNAKYNIGVTQLLAALSGKNFVGLREQVIIVDACANFIHEMKLQLPPPESGFALGDTRDVRQEALLAAVQGEKASAAQDAESGSFGHTVLDWLEVNAPTLPPPMEQLSAAVIAHFEQLRRAGVARQRPMRIREIRYGTETDHAWGDEPVSGYAWRATQRAGLTADQVRRTAAAIAALPQLADDTGRTAVLEAIADASGVTLPRTGDQEADMVELVATILERSESAALFRTLLELAADDQQRTAVVAVRHRWEKRLEVVPLLAALRAVPWLYVHGALAATVPDLPAGVTELDRALDLLTERSPARGWPPLMAEFIHRLRRRRPGLELPAGWSDGYGLDAATEEWLDADIAAESHGRRKLVIDLRESGPAARPSAVAGHLSPRWRSKVEPCGRDNGGVRGAVVRIIEWARALSSDLSIGFVVDAAMLRELPEQWEYEDSTVPPFRLCEEYPVVLHAAERMSIQGLLAPWARKLTSIGTGGDAPPGVLWLDQDDATAIRRAVKKSDDAYVALAFVPQPNADPRRNAVMAAIAAGAPHVIWVQSPPADDYQLRAELGPLFGRLEDFPEALRRGRVGDEYLSGALRVIFDSPDELPPQLDRLGERLTADD